jgi:hypothetical protein
MPRVTHVAKAQQRYETVPVIDPETGEPKRTPVMRGGEQKTTKTGRPVFMTVTRQDRSKPKEPLSCDFPGCDIDGGKILPGSPYFHITPKSGPYGGYQRSRHAQHRGWYQWEYSSSLGARLAQVEHDFSEAISSAESTDDVQEALDDAKSSVEEIAEEKREGASNIEDGFGHATTASEELESVADELDQWAEEISSADIPDMVECEECNEGRKECEDCEGTGQIDDDDDSDKQIPCRNCNGDGDVECDNCDGTGEDIEAWRDEVNDSVTIVGEPPV